jgi:hypothetical protein
MRTVIIIDRFGYKRAYLCTDDMSDEEAEQGIPRTLPDLDLIEWEEVKKQLNNMLVDRGIFTLADVYNAQNAVSSTCRSVLKNRIVNLYRNRNREVKSNE